MDTDDFAKQFFDFWHERLLRWQLEAIIESKIGRGEASVERTRVVRFWHRDMLFCYLRGPESISGLSLLDSFFCEMCVGPGDGVVSVLF